jgi:small-conductance mechanosensitive channel
MMNWEIIDGGAILDWFLGAPVRIVAVILIALVARSLIIRAITKAMDRIASADLIPGKNRTLSRQRERAQTAGTVLRSITNAVIALIAVGTILSEAGINLAPLIASAGVLGVALGLGSQTLIRDFIAGLFMLLEDQYGVGDQVSVLDIDGVVESVGLRITTIRAKDGALWYLRNGEILKIGNRSKQ